jgi:hypothetical protein
LEIEKESNKWDAKMTQNPKIIELSLFCEIPNTLFKGNLELQVTRSHGSFN